MQIPYEDYLDMGHLNKLLAMGYNSMSQKKRAAAAKKMVAQQRRDYLDEIEAHAQAGEWDEVCSIIMMRPFIMEEGFCLYYDRIPDDMKYWFVTEIFTHHGDHYPVIREALTHALDYGKANLPEWMGETVTVYRGGTNSIDDVKWAISWTTEQDVAEFFANRRTLITGKKTHVYRASILASEIIAYTNARSEQEVMQYGSVYDVEEIPFIPGRVKQLDENGHCVSSDVAALEAC